MFVDAIFDRTSQIVDKAMQVRMLRQGFIASNIANADTPGFRAVDIDFRATMQRAVAAADAAKAPAKLEPQRTDPRHFGAADAPDNKQIVFKAADAPMIGNDSNSVSLEVEIGKMRGNASEYAALSQILSKRLALVNHVIDGSSRT